MLQQMGYPRFCGVERQKQQLIYHSQQERGQRDLGSFISCCRAVFSLVCCMGGVGELLPTMGLSLISILS